jgi:hypothetical protein
MLLLVGCATHDVLHSEPLVGRAACRDRGSAVFGLWPDEDSCGAQVTPLGDGCYLAMRPGEQRERPHVFECNANGPGNRVACLEEPIGGRVRPLDADAEVVWGLNVWMGGEYASIAASRRCEPRLVAWESVHAPPLPPAILDVQDHAGHHSYATVRENGVEVGRAARGPDVRAEVCPDSVTLVGEYPPIFAEELRHLIGALPRPETCETSYYFLHIAQ